MSDVDRPVRYRLSKIWLVVGVGFLAYTVFRLIEMTVWLVRAIW